MQCENKSGPPHGHQEQDTALSRRRFMTRMAVAGVTIAAAGSASLWLYDPKGPKGGGGKAASLTIPDFSVGSAVKKVAVARGEDRAKTLAAALAAMGGIGQFIRKGDRVLVKVNAAFASPSILSATTHPALVGEVIRLCLQAGAAEVVVSDNPINDPDSCFRLTGIAEATEKAGGKLVLPRAPYFKPYTLENATLIRRWPVLYEPLRGINKLIGVAPVKDHNRAGASMSMKNWYGLLGGRRNVFHQDVHTLISELAVMIKPTFVILDGTTTMMTNGPTGGATSDLKPTNTMIVSTDQVAADAFGCTLLGRQISDLPYIEKAASLGCGTADLKAIKVEEV
jgi:uncharacterized protein (DUF362 family)